MRERETMTVVVGVRPAEGEDGVARLFEVRGGKDDIGDDATEGRHGRTTEIWKVDWREGTIQLKNLFCPWVLMGITKMSLMSYLCLYLCVHLSFLLNHKCLHLSKTRSPF